MAQESQQQQRASPTTNTEQNKKNAFYAAVMPPSYKRHLAYSGFVKSLSAKNGEGTFDILPLHENFVSMVSGTVRIVDESGKELELSVDKALIEASNNLVKVFVEF